MLYNTTYVIISIHAHFSSCPITSQEVVGEKVETVTDLIFLGSKTTVDCDCNHEIKRRLLLGRKAMTNLDGVLKSQDIILPSKVCMVKAVVFFFFFFFFQYLCVDVRVGP